MLSYMHIFGEGVTLQTGLVFWATKYRIYKKKLYKNSHILAKYFLPNYYWHSPITICINNNTQEIYFMIKWYKNIFLMLFPSLLFA